MYVDALTEVSSAQAIANGTPVVSTSSIDLTAASRLGNTCHHFNVNVSAAAATGLVVEVVGADDAALTSNVVSLGSTGVVTPAVGKNFTARAVNLNKKRYIGLRYTTSGGTPTATVTAAAVVDRQATWQD